MKECLLSLLLVIVLSGCIETLPTVKEVNVPVAVRCDPISITKPTLILETTPKTVSLFEKLKAALADNEALKEYSTKLEAANLKCIK